MTTTNEPVIADLQKKVASGENALWWSWRLLNEVASSERVEAESRQIAVQCFIRLANADAMWARSSLTARDPHAIRLAELLDGSDILATAQAISASSDGETALLRAAVFVGVAGQPGKRDAVDLWRAAWDELATISEPDRDEAWRALAIHPAAHVAYDVFKELAAERLKSAESHFWRAQALSDAFMVAARYEDWETFDEWAAAYRALPPALRRGHQLCALLNIEGNRALDDGDTERAEVLMRLLIDAAADAEFLSNDEVSSFPRRVAKAGLFDELSAAFADLVANRDWRNLDEGLS